MSNARIIEIPATRQIRSGKNNTMRKMRVAAYCRVSTEEEEQQGSFETQKLYYTEKINSTSEWELAGIYADDGISGIHTKKRDGFNQMIQDCKKKKIDLILTKSISRFARNTLDSIQYVRMLKAIGIAVIFEKENINTSTMNSEMILTVLSAFAQAESESISQNVARGKRMGFRQGKFPFPYGQILGYRKGLDGKPEVIPEEAEVIRMIFNSYLQGASLLTIKKKLEAGGVLTARGNKKWSSESVQRILQNEKYCGDVLLQKTFIEDVLTGVSKKNTGQLPQYYIENNHEGIVADGVVGNDLICGSADNDFQTGQAVEAVVLGEAVQQDADNLLAVRQINMGNLALTAAHRGGVDGVALCDILGDFSGEFLVDIDVLHFVSLLSFLPYSDKIEGGRGKAPGSPLLICGAEWRS